MSRKDKNGLAPGSMLCPHPDCVAEVKQPYVRAQAGPEFPCPRCRRPLRVSPKGVLESAG